MKRIRLTNVLIRASSEAKYFNFIFDKWIIIMNTAFMINGLYIYSIVSLRAVLLSIGLNVSVTD